MEQQDYKTKTELAKATAQDYWDYFFDISDGYNKEAFEETEMWYRKKYGFGKYSDYDSFRGGKMRYQKELLKRGNGASTKKGHR